MPRVRAQTLGEPEDLTAIAIVNNDLASGAGTVLTVIQMQISADGEGKGTLSVATRIIARGDVIELENFATRPVMLTEIKSEKAR